MQFEVRRLHFSIPSDSDGKSVLVFKLGSKKYKTGEFVAIFDCSVEVPYPVWEILDEHTKKLRGFINNFNYYYVRGMVTITYCSILEADDD